ncbi:hypothetical protein A9Q99_16675 [Gammaproteobacteria bacterium 45_16_T64]|nr:hypothetical protein A9Q99_16675 [Gammaproteobacteria bacterium 45_16_T64]
MKVLSVASSLAFTLAIASPVLAVSPDVIHRGWKPSVEFAGAGDSSLAVNKMREMAALQQAVFSNIEYHAQTQEFIDDMWASLERFNLKKFYRILPEESGEWRQLTVVGGREGESYRMGPSSADISEDSIVALGDLVSHVRAKEIASESSGTSYLIQNDLQVGISAFSWDAVLGSGEEILRLAVEGDQRFAQSSKEAWVQDYRIKVKAMNPALNEGDIEILAPLWAAFPESWNLLSKLGRVDDVVMEANKKGAYQHLKASFTLLPDQMEQLYPDLADHLDGLNSLLSANIEISDENGRLVQLSIDSEKLTGSIDAYIADGRFLPVDKDGVVITSAPEAPGGERRFFARVDSTMDILGVVTHMKGIDTSIVYHPNSQGAVIQSAMTTVPSIEVEGAAFGFMPTGLIDLFLPTNIDELMREFMTVAVKGNDGKGIVSRAEFAQSAVGGLAKLRVGLSVEALNNFMVRIGMGIVTDRIIPDDDVSGDIQHLLADTESAFSKDLDGFEKASSLSFSVVSGL